MEKLTKKYIANTEGFTLLETMVTLSITILIFVLAIISYSAYERDADLQSQVDIISSKMDLARERTLSSYTNSIWGLRVSTSSVPQSIVLFKGMDYETRDPADDVVTNISNKVRITDVDFEGKDWVVFKRLSGRASTTGSILLELVSDTNMKVNIFLNKEGLNSNNPFNPVADSERIKDFRHMHIKYSRTIDTVNESVVLIFDGGAVTESIPINDNLLDGQFYWSGELEVGGVMQRLVIRSHELNDPDTIFSIHRRVDQNNASLAVNLSGDAWVTPQLISYSGDGETVATGSSPFVDYISRQ